MHEMDLCNNIRDILEDESQKNGFNKITKVVLEIGALGNVAPDSIEFCFPIAMKNSVADSCILEIEIAKAKAFCMQCLETFEMKSRHAGCPSCNSNMLQFESGDELKIKFIEVL